MIIRLLVGRYADELIAIARNSRFHEVMRLQISKRRCQALQNHFYFKHTDVQ